MEELLRKREDFGDISTDMQILEAERARLSLLEEKIKEVLVMLRALNSTVSKSFSNFAIYKTIMTIPYPHERANIHHALSLLVSNLF